MDKRCRLITIDWKIVLLTTECLGHCFTNNDDHSSSNERIMPYSIVPRVQNVSQSSFYCCISRRNCCFREHSHKNTCLNRWESVSTWFFKSFHEWNVQSSNSAWQKTPFAVTSQVLSLFKCNLNFLHHLETICSKITHVRERTNQPFSRSRASKRQKTAKKHEKLVLCTMAFRSPSTMSELYVLRLQHTSMWTLKATKCRRIGKELSYMLMDSAFWMFQSRFLWDIERSHRINFNLKFII